MESIIYNEIYNHFVTNNLLLDLQHGLKKRNKQLVIFLS